VTDRASSDGASSDRAQPPSSASTERVAAALLDAVAVMHELRSPGGCPWDAEQTTASLAPYAVEEAFEVAEAAESGDLDALREELGDLLLQVLFHARVASEVPASAGGFSLADVAEGLSAKLRRRHPHVFPDASGSVTDASDAEAVNRQWDRIKAAERAASAEPAAAGAAADGSGRSSVLDGIPEALPALMRAQKVLRRARRAGIAVGPVFPDALDDLRPAGEGAAADAAADALAAEVGAELLAVVARAEAAGVDAEGALRAQVRGIGAQVREAEHRG